jgi:hypothetical protein
MAKLSVQQKSQKSNFLVRTAPVDSKRHKKAIQVSNYIFTNVTLRRLNADFSNSYLPPSDFSVAGETTQKMQDKFSSNYKPLVTLDNLITEDLGSSEVKYINGVRTRITYTDVKQYESFIKNAKANVYKDIYAKMTSISTDLLSSLHEKYQGQDEVKKDAIISYLENMFDKAKRLTPTTDGKSIPYGSNSDNIKQNPALCRLLLAMPQHLTELTRLSLTGTDADTIRSHLEHGAKLFDLSYIESLENEIEKLETKITDRSKETEKTPAPASSKKSHFISLVWAPRVDPKAQQKAELVEKAKQVAKNKENDKLNKEDMLAIDKLKAKISYTQEYMNSFVSELGDTIDLPQDYTEINKPKKPVERVTTI